MAAAKARKTRADESPSASNERATSERASKRNGSPTVQNDDEVVERGKRKRGGRDDAADAAQEEDEETEDEATDMDASLSSQEKRDKSHTEMGVIEEIYCENFMCHRKMRVQLSPHINFITGENGSGKSAIIAAIQICLGASARSTHRGKSIKNLIRHGHDGHALVRITLRNDAAKEGDAFRPKVFGKKIIVERLIRRDGSAEYRLKNEHGAMVSKLKNDLDAMLDHLNIQTENPCAILDQENAKLFLKGNPTDKYKFFLQSTDLYKMRNTYGKIDEETRHLTDSVLRREKVKVAALREAMEDAVQRWEEAQSIGKLEEEFVQVKKELAWSFVHEKELEAEKIAKKMRIKQRDEEEIREKYEEVTKMVSALETKQRKKNDELDTTTTRLQDVQRRKEEAKNAIREARRPLHAHHAEQKQIRQQRERTLVRIQRLEKDIENKRRAHETMIRSRLARNDEMRDRIERKRHELEQLQHEVEEASRVGHAPNERIDQLEHQYEECVRQRRDAESEISGIQSRISGLRSQKRDSLAIYGNKIPQLQQLIQENLHRFSAPPIGPLGLHVKLPERFMKFAKAIEVALKGSLQSYLVVNGRDKGLLDELKRRIHCPPNQATIIIAKRSGRRYSNLRLPAGSLADHAICNVLEINNDDVFNALVDVCNTEGKLLYNDKGEAERAVLTGNSGNLRMASNVTEVYLPSGDRFQVRNGNLAYIANKSRNRSSVICQDVEADIRDQESHLQYLQGNYELLRRDESRLRRERDDVVNESRRESDRLNDLTRRFNQRRVELRNLEYDLADDAQQNTLDTTVLEEEVVEAQKEIKAFDARDADLEVMIHKFNPDLEGLLKDVDDLTATEKDLMDSIQELQEDVTGVFTHLSEVKAQELRYEREAAAAGEFVAKWTAELAEIQDDCEELSKKAKAVCESDERIEVTQTHDFYGKRLTDIKHKIDQERSRFQGMDLNDLAMDKEEKSLKYMNKQSTYEAFSSNVERVRSMLEERKRVWAILRKEIAHRTSMEFNKYMNINSFAGKLRFRHDDQRLEIAVLHNDKGKSRNSQVTDMKELSGGERSYTQVSLLLALGESIECPFRVMDEFDVFMDSVNRDMTIQLLVDAAKRDCNKQFIFVTPNDLSALRKDPMVKIQKMDPPRDRLNAEHTDA